MPKQQRWDARYAHKSDAFSSSKQWKQEAYAFILEFPKQGAVLDFACNTGRFLEETAKIRPYDLALVGVDINQEALKIARQRVPQALFCEDVQDLEPESITHAVCLHALPQLEFPEKELTGVWRALKRGGRFSLITNNKFNDWLWAPMNLFTGYRHDQTRFHNYSLNEVARLMKDSGFVLDSIEFSGKVRFGRLLPFIRPRIVYHGHKAGEV